MSVKTDVVIRGTDKERKTSLSSVKLQKARELNIDVLDESDSRVAMLKSLTLSSGS